MAKDVITRKDLIEDQALTLGTEYAKNMQQAIDANKVFVASLKEMAPFINQFRKSDTQQAYVELKNQENLVTLKAINANKLLEASEISLQKIQRESINTQKSEIDLANKKEAVIKKNTQLTIEEKVQIEANNKALKQAAREVVGLVLPYEKLNKQRTDSKNKLRDLIAAENSSTEAIKKAQKEFDTLDKKVRKADDAVNDFTKNVGNYPLKNVTSSIKNLIGAFGVTGGLIAFANIMKGAYQTIKNFEQGIADLSAITGASGKDLEYLKNQAIELGKGTKGGAIAVVEAYKLIASAKPELLENVQALNLVTEAVLTLSKASGLELPDAATRLTDAMNQFNAPASEAATFIDALANGAKYGAAEIPDITDALLKFGSVARSTNVSIQESTALIELLAENGLKGADAGTALRNVLLKISAPDALPKKAREEFERLGISLETLKDKSIPIQKRLELLKPLLKDNASIVKIFGLENTVAAQNIISHTDRLKDLTSKMYDYGTAQQQADIETDTLQGDTDKLSSTYDSFILSIGKGSGVVGEFFRFFVQGAKNALDGLIRLNTSWEELNNQSRKKGSDYVFKVFNVDKSKEELEKERNVISTEMEKTAREIDRLKKELEDRNFLQTFNPFSKGSAVRKKEIENLYNTLGQYEAAYKKIQSKLNPAKTKNNATTATGTVAVNDAETEKEEKARLKRLKALNDAEYELQKQRLERSSKLNQDVANDDELSDEIRIKALENVQDKEFKLVALTKKHKLDYDKFVSDEDKLNAKQKLIITEEAGNKIVDITKKTQEQIVKLREFDTKVYEDNLKRSSNTIEIANQTELAAENDRYNKLKELGFKNDKEKEKAAEDHERILFNIKKEGLIAQTRLQIANLSAELDAYELQSDGSQKSQDFILEKRTEVAKLSTRLTEEEGSSFNENEKKKEKYAREQVENVLNISSEALGHLSELSNAFSQRKIQNVESEISASNEYYDKQIELAGNDERQKTLLGKERAKKEEELQKKLNAEKNKQAKIEKAVTIAQIGIKTALAVINGFAESGYVGAIFAAALGAIQLAVAIATPIPKYKMGRKGGPAELAITGDGGVPEVISRPDGSGALMTPNKPTLTYLQKDDIVHKSVADYNNYMRASVLNGFHRENTKANNYQHGNLRNDNSDLLLELRKNTDAIKRQKTTVNVLNKIDLGYENWRMSNINWRR